MQLFLRLKLLTSQTTSIKLHPHSNVGIPRFGMNPDVSSFYSRVYPTRDCMINVVVTTKHLKTQKRGNSCHTDDVTFGVIIRRKHMSVL